MTFPSSALYFPFTDDFHAIWCSLDFIILLDSSTSLHIFFPHIEWRFYVTQDLTAVGNCLLQADYSVYVFEKMISIF